MDEGPFLVSLFLGGAERVRALVDSGCECFCAIDEAVARRVSTQFLELTPRSLRQAAGPLQDSVISRLAVVECDIDGWPTRLVAYVVPNLHHDIILGKPWMRREGVVLDVPRGLLTIGRAGGMVVYECDRALERPEIATISVEEAAEVAGHRARISGHGGAVLVTSIHALTHALRQSHPSSGGIRPFTEPELSELPPELAAFRDLFDKDKASGLPPHRGRLDHHINLSTDARGREQDAPWGPL